LLFERASNALKGALRLFEDLAVRETAGRGCRTHASHCIALSIVLGPLRVRRAVSLDD
jgi:hypothetical protein